MPFPDVAFEIVQSREVLGTPVVSTRAPIRWDLVARVGGVQLVKISNVAVHVFVVRKQETRTGADWAGNCRAMMDSDVLAVRSWQSADVEQHSYWQTGGEPGRGIRGGSTY